MENQSDTETFWWYVDKGMYSRQLNLNFWREMPDIPSKVNARERIRNKVVNQELV